MSEASPAQPGTPAAATRAAVATAGALAALEVGGWAARDALFLSELPATSLPPTIMASALLAITATFALSRWMQRSRPDRVAPAALCAAAAGFCAIGLLIPARPGAAAVALYLHMTGFAPVVASAFWSVVNERFDPYTAKRIVSRMAAAAALGGVAGGIAAERIATAFGMPVAMIALAAIALACAFGARRLGAPRTGASLAPEAQAAPEEASISGLAWIRRRPLLRQMAALMLVAAIVETLVDYALKVEAAAAFPDGDSLLRFFAAFYVICGLLSFAIQAVAGDRFLRRFGLATAVAILPASVAATGAIAVGVARLWGFVAVRGAETVASGSFFRAGFQLLYTPVPPAAKRPAKVWVDVASGSIGEIVGAGIVLALLALLPVLPSQTVVAIAVVGCIVALGILRRIHRGYVNQLAESLRSGQVAMRVDEALDATTARTIAESQVALDRRSLLEQVRDHAAREEASVVAMSEGNAAAAAELEAPDPTASWVADLVGNDTTRVRRVLRRAELEPGATPARRRALAAHVVPLLEVDELGDDAEAFLRQVSGGVVGLLCDRLLDPAEPIGIRVRLARILGRAAESAHPRAMEGLWRGVADADFEVRLACARGATRIASRAPALAPDASAVHERIEAELEADEEMWSRQGRRPPGDRSVLLGRRALRGVSRSLEQVFTLLALVHERRVMASVLAGLTSDDPGLRGTALEYLESVLPAGLRGRLWPRLHAGEMQAHSDRAPDEMSEELLRSSVAVVLDAEDLGSND